MILEVKIGEVYGWDVKNDYSSLHIGTYSVKVLDSKNDFLICESLQTGEIFDTGMASLTEIEVCNRMYNALINHNCEAGSHEEWAKNKTLIRLIKVLGKDSITSTKDLSKKEISTQIFNVFTDADVKTLSSVLELCLDNKDYHLCKEVSLLKRKMEYNIAEGHPQKKKEDISF